MKTLTDILQSNNYTSEYQTCQGCTNHCVVRLFHFDNGNTFYSGNNCEKIYSNSNLTATLGTNIFNERYKLLFNRDNVNVASNHKSKSPLKIGIPRALGIYENYPFWHALFSHCGFKVVLSQPSTNRLYQNGIHTVMADNICFPAKLMHGHIVNLVHRMVDRIFYPFVVFENKEDAHSANSFNCPVVSAYSDVIRSAIAPQKRYGIPLDSPTISFNNHNLLTKACCQYLQSLGVDKSTAIEAIKVASQAQTDYLNQLALRNQQVLDQAIHQNRMVILLAGRPYHTDPLIEHKISNAIAEMGVDVITETIAVHSNTQVYSEINSLTQWAYPNRIFKAAHFVANHSYHNLHYVQLTSFGCGPDAFILDEVSSLLRRYNKNLTLLKIDDVNNIGSLRLRIRSLVESAQHANLKASKPQSVPQPFVTTKRFEVADKPRTILAPYFAEGYSEFLPSLLKVAGYRMVNLPMSSQADAETGLRHANNDVCYPATIVIGSIINALKSGEYDLNNTAIIITQTGGQCRASNYMALIKNAMVAEGFAHVPVVSMALGAGLNNAQPGFSLPLHRIARLMIHTILYADCLAQIYHSAVVRPLQSPLQPLSARQLYNKYIHSALPIIERNDHRALIPLLKQAAHDFAVITDTSRRVPTIGLVGEIYVKYNSFSNKGVIPWLIEQGVEVIPPSLIGFFSTAFVNAHVNHTQHIKPSSTISRFLSDSLYHYITHLLHSYDAACSVFPFYRPFITIFDNARLASDVINLAADFGEGWFLPGEICHLAHSGVNNVISLQPFGCIANHIISKGIEKRLKHHYPHLNLLFLDFDSGTSEANVFNRLHFMLRNAQHELSTTNNSPIL